MSDRIESEPRSTDGRIERAKDLALGGHDSHPSLGDEIGEAAGGISGVLVGAGIGSAAGPVGTLVGGIAGALGGWWAGRAVTEAASALTSNDDTHFRHHFESRLARPADQRYEDVRGAYYYGHLAGRNPDYLTRDFAEAEPELERGWAASGERMGNWDAVRWYAHEGFRHGRVVPASSAKQDAPSDSQQPTTERYR